MLSKVCKSRVNLVCRIAFPHGYVAAVMTILCTQSILGTLGRKLALMRKLSPCPRAKGLQGRLMLLPC